MLYCTGMWRRASTRIHSVRSHKAVTCRTFQMWKAAKPVTQAWHSRVIYPYMNLFCPKRVPKLCPTPQTLPSVRSETFVTAVNMMIASWYVRQWNLVIKYRLFGGTKYSDFKGSRIKIWRRQVPLKRQCIYQPVRCYTQTYKVTTTSWTIISKLIFIIIKLTHYLTAIYIEHCSMT